jgi:membrane protein DedA with SNARE-associated domain
MNGQRTFGMVTWTEERRRSRRRALLLAGPIVLFTALGMIGTIFTPQLAPHHPLLLIALEARDRNLLAARHAPFVPFVIIGTLRRIISDPFFYLLGRRYGQNAVRWLERHAGGPRVVGTLEQAFRHAAYPMLIVFPGAIVCALAGEVGIPPLVFGIIVVVRTIAAVLLLRMLGNVFAGPIDSVLHFLDRNSVALTIIFAVSIVGWWAYGRFGKHEPSALAEIHELEEEPE